jgi:hypothetical protein
MLRSLTKLVTSSEEGGRDLPVLFVLEEDEEGHKIGKRLA